MVSVTLDRPDVVTDGTRLRKWLGRLLPYGVAAGAVALILGRYSISDIAREVARGHALATIPLAVAGLVCTLLLVAVADAMVIRENLGPAAPGYLDVVRGKAASVVLFLVHYGLGQGAYAAWIARRTGSTAKVTGGVLLFIVASELCSICLLASLVIVFGARDVPSSLSWTVAGISGVLVLFILMGPWRLRVVDRITFFHPWTRRRASRGVAQIAVRVLQHAVGVLAAALAARAFGLDIPLPILMAYLPVISVIASLPVNVAGFGAVQAAWLLLEPWAPGEQILAFSFVWQLVASSVATARGLPFVRGVVDEIRRGAAPPSDDLPAFPSD